MCALFDMNHIYASLAKTFSSIIKALDFDFANAQVAMNCHMHQLSWFSRCIAHIYVTKFESVIGKKYFANPSEGGWLTTRGIFISKRQLTTWKVFRQVERRFHNQISIRQPLPWDLGMSPPSSSSLGPSRTTWSVNILPKSPTSTGYFSNSTGSPATNRRFLPTNGVDIALTYCCSTYSHRSRGRWPVPRKSVFGHTIESVKILVILNPTGCFLFTSSGFDASIHFRYMPLYIPLQRSVNFLKSWSSASYFSNSTGSSATNRRFYPDISLGLEVQPVISRTQLVHLQLTAGSSRTFPEVLKFSQLFLELNRFICN